MSTSRQVIVAERVWRSILDSVRTKCGISKLLKSTEVASLIASVSGGGGDELITRSVANVQSDVTSVGDHAFDGCVNLVSVSLPNVTQIGTYAFSGCTSLPAISLPKITDISINSFQNCTSLTTIDMPMAEAIGAYAFRSCSSVVSVFFPNVKSIGAQSFQSSAKLCRAEFSQAVKINNLSFSQTKLDSLILPNLTPSTLAATSAFTNTPIAQGTGYIYVPGSMIDDYKSATNWSAYSEAFRAIEDYPDMVSGGESVD